MRQISAPDLNRSEAGKKSGRLQRAVWDRPRPLRAHWQHAVWDRPHPLCAGLRGVGLSQTDRALTTFFRILHKFANGLQLKPEPEDGANDVLGARRAPAPEPPPMPVPPMVGLLFAESAMRCRARSTPITVTCRRSPALTTLAGSET